MDLSFLVKPGRLFSDVFVCLYVLNDMKCNTHTGVGTSDVFASYTDDPLLLTFARQFCDTLGRRTAMELKAQVWGGGVHGGPLSGVPSSMERWCARVLYECVVYDKPVALFLYLQLHHAALTIHWINSLTQTWSIRIALELFCLSSSFRTRRVFTFF